MRQTDAAGNVTATPYQTAGAWTIDTAAPAALTLSITDTGSSTSDGKTTNATVTIGNKETNATWEYSTDSGGNWAAGSGTTFTLGANITYSAGQVRVRQTDVAGNVSSAYQSPIAWTIDNTAPAALTLSLTDTGTSSTDGITNNATITIGNLESGATWQYSTNSGSSWTTGSGTTFTLAAGTYTAGSVRVHQTDVAGNLGADYQSPNTWTFDTTAPTPTPVDTTGSSASSINVKSTETGTFYLVHDTVSVTSLSSITSAADADWNSVAISTANTNTSLSLAGLTAGTYKAYAVDAAGNLSSASVTTVTVTDPPAMYMATQTTKTMNFKFIKATALEGKTYYFLDVNNDGLINTSDYVAISDNAGVIDILKQMGWSSPSGGVLTGQITGALNITDGTISKQIYLPNVAWTSGSLLPYPTSGDGSQLFSQLGNCVTVNPNGEGNTRISLGSQYSTYNYVAQINATNSTYSSVANDSVSKKEYWVFHT